MILRSSLELVEAVAHWQLLEEELDGALPEEGADARQQPVSLQHHAHDVVGLGPETKVCRPLSSFREVIYLVVQISVRGCTNPASWLPLPIERVSHNHLREMRTPVLHKLTF